MIQGTVAVDMVTNDYLEYFVYHNYGSDRSLYGSVNPDNHVTILKMT